MRHVLQVGGRQERGAVAVEFALLVPLLVLLVFGIIGFGFIFSQNLALNNATRDAARFAVVKQIDGPTAERSCYDALVRTRANSRALGIQAVNVGVTLTVGGVTKCSIAAGTALPSTEPSTGPLASIPCKDSVSGVNDRLSVASVYQSRVPVPIVGRTTFNLAGTSSFRCEFR
jgi:Flp pilus assembly protein TadG